MSAKTRIMVIANCQAPVLARAMELLNPDIAATSLVIHQAKREKAAEYRQAMATSDAVLHFSVSPKFVLPELAETRSSGGRDGRLYSITNLYFSGLHPDFCTVGKLHHRVRGPFGEYHSRLIIGGYRLGLSVEDTTAMIADADLQEQLGYRADFDQSADELIRRDEGLDIRFSEAMVPLLTAKALPMFTFNHPAPWMMMEFAHYILTKIGLPSERVPREVLPGWLRGNTILPVFASVAGWHGLPYVHERWKRPSNDGWFSHEEAVRLFYDAYDEIPEDRLTFDGSRPFLNALRMTRAAA